MPKLSRPLRRPSATLLLLGLLALLLWGQCALNINDHGHYVPTVRVRVVRDSLAPATPGRPAQLYLTLALTNYLAQPCRLDTAYGNVSFKKQYWNFEAAGARGLTLPAADNRQQPVLLPVVVALVPPVDSLAAFRAALRTGSRADNSLRVFVRATYTTGSEPDRQWTAEAGSYLPAQLPR
jgi:hypothetical protein